MFLYITQIRLYTSSLKEALLGGWLLAALGASCSRRFENLVVLKVHIQTMNSFWRMGLRRKESGKQKAFTVEVFEMEIIRFSEFWIKFPTEIWPFRGLNPTIVAHAWVIFKGLPGLSFSAVVDFYCIYKPLEGGWRIKRLWAFWNWQERLSNNRTKVNTNANSLPFYFSQSCKFSHFLFLYSIIINRDIKALRLACTIH